MISVAEAKALVQAHSKPLPIKQVSLDAAAGLVLAEDVVSPIDMPPFDQAAMDGYAFAFEDYAQLKTLPVQGEIPAGHDKIVPQRSGQAVRIFTGAPVPLGADTVVMQEHVTVTNNELSISEPSLQQGANVRLKGAEIKSGALALPKGTFLSPGAIGFLASLGITTIPVYPKPTVALIVTGNELQQPGTPLQTGQVYESNSFTIRAALQQLHIYDIDTFFAVDNLNVLEQTLQEALDKYDMVLLTGGVSAGDYDFVIRAATACGVTQQFHKVAQRPGKPLFFGTRESKPIFGLPGNPASVLTCFYQYVVPALEAMLNRHGLLKKLLVPLAAYSKKAGLTHFLKGRFEGHRATPLAAQESFRLSSFALANCLIVLEQERAQYEEGELVEIHLLPS